MNLLQGKNQHSFRIKQLTPKLPYQNSPSFASFQRNPLQKQIQSTKALNTLGLLQYEQPFSMNLRENSQGINRNTPSLASLAQERMKENKFEQLLLPKSKIIKININEEKGQQQCQAKKLLQETLNDNQQYFKHMSGKCACAICRCGQCKCKFGKKNAPRLQFISPSFAKQTIYQESFIPQQTEHMKLNQEQAYGEFPMFGKGGIESKPLKTLYSTSFQRPITEQIVLRKNEKTNTAELQQTAEENDDLPKSTSSYQQQFLIWKNAPQLTPHIFRPNTVLQLKFQGSSNYQNNYLVKDKLPMNSNSLAIMKNNQNSQVGSMFHPEYKYFLRSSSQDNFKPKQQLYENQNWKLECLNKHFAINDKRPKDIRSVYGREYWNKYSECPGKQVLLDEEEQNKNFY